MILRAVVPCAASSPVVWKCRDERLIPVWLLRTGIPIRVHAAIRDPRRELFTIPRMTVPAKLLKRIDEIGVVAEQSGRAVALIGLGSVGSSIGRLDEYSDLDFFLIVDAGHKQAFLEDLGWLSGVAPLAYVFRNTVDGYKVLFADGVFAEFAVFEPQELMNIPYTGGRFVWRRPSFDAPMSNRLPRDNQSIDLASDWLLGEALTNLYIGMCRFRRGEKLSAERFVQVYAVGHVIALEESRNAISAQHRDPFAPDRRVEARLPAVASVLSGFVQGYDRIPQSAIAILDHLCRHWPVNKDIEVSIRRLCDQGGA